MPNGGKHPEEAWRRLEREALPFIGNISVGDIDAPAILSLLRRIKARGTIETAHKIKSYISQIIKYGIACGLILNNPARDLAGALSPRQKKPMAAIIGPKEAGALMRAIYGYEGGLVVRCGMGRGGY